MEERKSFTSAKTVPTRKNAPKAGLPLPGGQLPPLPRQRSVQLPPLLNTLEKIGYDGYLSVECLPYPNGKEALAYMKGLES